MGFAGIVPEVWLFWAMMIGGACLCLVGFWRSYDRFWHWRQVRAIYEGALVPATGSLPTGREVTLRPYAPAEAHDYAPTLAALVTVSGKRTLTLTLDAPLAPAQKPNTLPPLPAWLTLGATITAEFTDTDARYRFSARVQDVHANQGTLTLALAMPRWMEREQRRRDFRVPLPLPATFECTEGYAPFADNQTITLPPQHGTLVNLSVGGLCADLAGGASPRHAAQLLECYRPDTILRVRLPIPALSSQSVLVRVRKCERVAVRGGMGVRMACVFLAMPVWEQELVAQTVFEAQRQLLRERPTT
jgi:c-di-GMP-binding flagellar brake protein YcgR